VISLGSIVTFKVRIPRQHELRLRGASEASDLLVLVLVSGERAKLNITPSVVVTIRRSDFEKKYCIDGAESWCNFAEICCGSFSISCCNYSICWETVAFKVELKTVIFLETTLKTMYLKIKTFAFYHCFEIFMSMIKFITKIYYSIFAVERLSHNAVVIVSKIIATLRQCAVEVFPSVSDAIYCNYCNEKYCKNRLLKFYYSSTLNVLTFLGCNRIFSKIVFWL